MKLVRIKMLGEEGELHGGNFYNVPADVAEQLIVHGKAVEIYESKPTGPTEFKPAGPSEIKLEAKPKKKLRRGQTENES